MTANVRMVNQNGCEEGILTPPWPNHCKHTKPAGSVRTVQVAARWTQRMISGANSTTPSAPGWPRRRGDRRPRRGARGRQGRGSGPRLRPLRPARWIRNDDDTIVHAMIVVIGVVPPHAVVHRTMDAAAAVAGATTRQHRAARDEEHCAQLPAGHFASPIASHCRRPTGAPFGSAITATRPWYNSGLAASRTRPPSCSALADALFTSATRT